MRKHKISAFIPTQNVENIIGNTLKSISWVDEIFVVDSFSTDSTVEVCKSFPKAKVVQHEYENSGAQRIWGMPQVAHDWVLIIDSDEICTKELQNEIEKILSEDEPKYDGYQVPIRTMFFGKLQNHERHLGFLGMRLVKRETYKHYTLRRVHSTLDIPNKTKLTNNNAYIIHEPITNFENHIKKMIRYANWQAQDMYDKGVRANIFHFTIRPAFKFFNHYFIKLGFLDGVRGLILCGIASISIFMKYYKLFVLQNTKK